MTFPNNNRNFQTYLKNRSMSSFFLSPTTVEQVAGIIKKFDLKKALGPNSIPSNILTTTLLDISAVLADLFNLSFSTGRFPSLLKLVKVIPIFKNKGSQMEVSNYRPISLLSNIDKILEKVNKMIFK